MVQFTPDAGDGAGLFAAHRSLGLFDLSLADVHDSTTASAASRTSQGQFVAAQPSAMPIPAAV